MLTVPSDVVVCWSFKQTTVRKKVTRTPILKYYAIERRVCPNVELRSNRLAAVQFFCGRWAGIHLTATLTSLRLTACSCRVTMTFHDIGISYNRNFLPIYSQHIARTSSKATRVATFRNLKPFQAVFTLQRF